MIIINAMDDIQKLRNQDKVDKYLVDELEKYFKELTHSFTGTNNWQTFSLKEEGSIIILEERDNPHDLEEIVLIFKIFDGRFFKLFEAEIYQI